MTFAPSEFWQIVAFVGGLTVTALLLLVGHWFPWPKRLHRLAAYTYGCVAILIGAGIWLLLSNQRGVWLGVLAFNVVAGLATSLAYLIDAALTGRIARYVAAKTLDD